MNRRRFAQLAGAAAAPALGTAAGWLAAAPAQAAPLRTIGVLVGESPGWQRFWRLFPGFLRELGLVEGRNVRLEFRSDGGDVGRLPELAAELVQLKPDVIVVWSTAAAMAAKQATAAIPIVIALAGDPVASGLVQSLAQPGGNVTGIAGGVPIAAKCLQLLHDLLPAARRVAVLINAPNPFAKSFLAQNQEGAKAAGLTLVPVDITKPEDIDAAFAGFAKDRPDAVAVQASLAVRHVADLALQHRLPSIANLRGFVEVGGLMSYWFKEADMYRRAAAIVDKVLKGASPATLAVERPTKLELTVNAKTAKALGITVPKTLLAQVDEVIE
jgi:putative ABC transport system substrate-binding protein